MDITFEFLKEIIGEDIDWELIYVSDPTNEETD